MGLKNYIRNKINNFLDNSNYDFEDDYCGIDITVADSNCKSKSSPHRDPTLSFRLYSGSGGYVLEFMSQKNDYSGPETSQLYIIADSENLSEVVDKLITTEMLKA